MKTLLFALVLLITASAIIAGCTSPASQSGTPTTTPAVTQTPAPPTPIAGSTGSGGTNLSLFVDHGGLYYLNNKNGSFIDGELYIFAYDMNGSVLAWPYRPDQVGVNRSGMVDPNGVRHIGRMIELARDGGGYLYYVTDNPSDNNRSEFKLAYVKPVDSTWFVGSGIYLSNVPAQFNATEIEQLVQRVKEARGYAKAHGQADAARDFNDKNGTWADGSRYIFALSSNGTVLAKPFEPAQVGTNMMEVSDPNGVKVTAWKVAVAKDGGGFLYAEAYNPDTRKAGLKLCYIEPVDGGDWLVGSGIYAREK